MYLCMHVFTIRNNPHMAWRLLLRVWIRYLHAGAETSRTITQHTAKEHYMKSYDFSHLQNLQYIQGIHLLVMLCIIIYSCRASRPSVETVFMREHWRMVECKPCCTISCCCMYNKYSFLAATWSFVADKYLWTSLHDLMSERKAYPALYRITMSWFPSWALLFKASFLCLIKCKCLWFSLGFGIAIQ